MIKHVNNRTFFANPRGKPGFFSSVHPCVLRRIFVPLYAVAFVATKRCSPPFLGIFHIVRMGAQRKMAGINARLVVARMKDKLGPRRFAMDKKPGSSMGRRRPVVSFKRKIPVTRAGFGALPLPTLTEIPNFYFGPKLSFKNLNMLCSAHSRSIALILLLINVILTGCSTPPKPVKFAGRWEFCETVPGVRLACLPEEDVKALRQALIECSSKGRP